MSSIAFLVITSNSAAFPAGSRVGGYVNNGSLIELAGLEVERIIPIRVLAYHPEMWKVRH